MRRFRQELWFNTPTRVAFVNITRQVEARARENRRSIVPAAGER